MSPPNERVYTLDVRDPEGNVLMRWDIDASGRPCLGDGTWVKCWAIMDDVQKYVRLDREITRENST